MDDSLAFAGIQELASLLKKREISAVELAQYYLERIDRLNPQLNAFIAVTADRARTQARANILAWSSIEGGMTSTCHVHSSSSDCRRGDVLARMMGMFQFISRPLQFPQGRRPQSRCRPKMNGECGRPW